MTPQERANHPDWIVRCYGPEAAETVRRLRERSEINARRADRQDVIRLIALALKRLTQLAVVVCITYLLVEWLQETC